jgi:hypothetical protein
MVVKCQSSWAEFLNAVDIHMRPMDNAEDGMLSQYENSTMHSTYFWSAHIQSYLQLMPCQINKPLCETVHKGCALAETERVKTKTKNQKQKR